MVLKKLLTLIALLVAVPVGAQDAPAGNQPQNAIPVRCVNTLGTTFESCGGTSAAGTDVNVSGVNGAAPSATNPMPGRLTDGTSYYKATTPSDTQPVSAVSLPLPTGAATDSVLQDIRGYLDTVEIKLQSVIDNQATLNAKDFATQTTLALIKAKTDNLDALLSSLATASAQTTGNASLGSLDKKLPSDPAREGGNLATLVANTKAHGASAAPAMVMATDQNTTLLASNASRVAWRVCNQSRSPLFLKFGSTATRFSYSVQVPASTCSTEFSYTGQVDAVWDIGADQFAMVSETQ